MHSTQCMSALWHTLNGTKATQSRVPHTHKVAVIPRIANVHRRTWQYDTGRPYFPPPLPAELKQS